MCVCPSRPHTPTLGIGAAHGVVLPRHYHLPYKEVKVNECFFPYETPNLELSHTKKLDLKVCRKNPKKYVLNPKKYGESENVIIFFRFTFYFLFFSKNRPESCEK